MNEFTKDLGIFLSRDVMYIIGGTSFLLSVAFAFGISYTLIISEPVTIYAAIFIFGIAYCLGYMNQELLSLTMIVTTRHIAKANRILCWLYRLHTNTQWESIDAPTDLDLIILRKFYKPEELKELDRIISLKHIGSAVGSNWFISSLILIVCAVDRDSLSIWIMSLYILFASLLLILFAWIRGMQQTMLINELNKERQKYS